MQPLYGSLIQSPAWRELTQIVALCWCVNLNSQQGSGIHFGCHLWVGDLTEQRLEVERPTHFGAHKFPHCGIRPRLFKLAKNALLCDSVDLPIGLSSIDHRLKNH